MKARGGQTARPAALLGKRILLPFPSPRHCFPFDSSSSWSRENTTGPLLFFTEAEEEKRSIQSSTWGGKGVQALWSGRKQSTHTEPGKCWKMDFWERGWKCLCLPWRRGKEPKVSSQQVLVFSTEMWSEAKPSCQALPLIPIPFYGQVMPKHLKQIFAGRKCQQRQGISIPWALSKLCPGLPSLAPIQTFPCVLTALGWGLWSGGDLWDLSWRDGKHWSWTGKSHWGTLISPEIP